jgi:hypothetical protein
VACDPVERIFTVPALIDGTVEQVANALADKELSVFVEGGQPELAAVLKPSVTWYYLATSPEERAEARAQANATAWAWVAAHRSVVLPSVPRSDWKTRDLERRVHDLELCVDFGVMCP